MQRGAENRSRPRSRPHAGTRADADFRLRLTHGGGAGLAHHWIGRSSANERSTDREEDAMAKFDLESLVRSFPSREDIVQALGSSHSTTREMSGLGLFGLGLLIGAGAALLLAPKAGTELRRDLSDRLAHARADGGYGERPETGSSGVGAGTTAYGA
jgi:hypothetical protein